MNEWASRIGRKRTSLQDMRFLWFERAFMVLGLRFPVGVTVVGLLPALVIIFGPSLVGYPTFGGERGLILGSIYFVTLTIQLYGARYVCSRHIPTRTQSYLLANRQALLLNLITVIACRRKTSSLRSSRPVLIG